MTTKPIREKVQAARRLVNDALGATDPKVARELLHEALAKLAAAETATHASQTGHDQTVAHYEAALGHARKVAAEAGVPGAELAELTHFGRAS